MQIQRTCKQCGTPLGINKKLGARYCNHSCSQGYYKRRKAILEKIRKLEQEVIFNEKWKEENTLKSKELEATKTDPSPMKEELAGLKKSIDTINRLLNSPSETFYNLLVEYLEKHMNKFEDDYGLAKYGTRYERQEVLTRHQNRYGKIRNQCFKNAELLEKEIKEIENANEKINIDSVFLLMRNIGIKSDNDKTKDELAELRAIDLDNLPPRVNPKKLDQNNPKIKHLVKGVTGTEILKMKFDNLELDGALGNFLGLIQRGKCAIALTGDSGAGKTTFSFKLAKSFRNAGQSVGYFSLESGITETTQTIIEDLNLTGSKFEVFGEGDLEDVRLRASIYDCIIVDSYAKISSKAEDFEALREDFPNTFFIIIFQKTTDGKIRGGSSILYNSTATIDIRLTKGNHRIAIMRKSRYGTENFVYSISSDRLLKSNRLPIKWSEIEENWTSPDHH